MPRVGADTRGGDGVFVHIETDEEGGIVSHAVFRLRKPMSVPMRRSGGSGLWLTREHGLSEVSAALSESHTV